MKSTKKPKQHLGGPLNEKNVLASGKPTGCGYTRTADARQPMDFFVHWRCRKPWQKARGKLTLFWSSVYYEGYEFGNEVCAHCKKPMKKA